MMLELENTQRQKHLCNLRLLIFRNGHGKLGCLLSLLLCFKWKLVPRNQRICKDTKKLYSCFLI